eukprot:1979002-Prymnesium_polylepis.1
MCSTAGPTCSCTQRLPAAQADVHTWRMPVGHVASRGPVRLLIAARNGRRVEAVQKRSAAHPARRPAHEAARAHRGRRGAQPAAVLRLSAQLPAARRRAVPVPDRLPRKATRPAVHALHSGGCAHLSGPGQRRRRPLVHAGQRSRSALDIPCATEQELFAADGHEQEQVVVVISGR